MENFMKKKNIDVLFNLIFVVVVYLLLSFFISSGILNNYYRDILINILIYVILAVSLNLTIGFLGQLTLGHAGFMAIGAYTSAIITKAFIDANPVIIFPIAIIGGGLAAALFGVIIGIPALRLRGDYLAIITLGFGEIIKNIIQNLKVTGGAKGFNFIPRYTNFTIAFVIMVFTVYFIYALIRSRHGRAIISIREDEIAAEASGIDTTFYKIFTFALSAFFAGVAGSLYAHQMGTLVPTTFNYNFSIEMVIIVVLGGMGSLTGSIISAFFLTALPQILSDFEKYRILIYSIMLITVMIFKPSGILGKNELSIVKVWNYVMNWFNPEFYKKMYKNTVKRIKNLFNKNKPKKEMK